MALTILALLAIKIILICQKHKKLLKKKKIEFKIYCRYLINCRFERFLNIFFIISTKQFRKQCKV